MSTRAERKTRLRRVLRARRRSIAPERARQASQRVAAQVECSCAWQRAEHIGLYWPNDGELDPTPIARRAWSAAKRVYLPVVQGRALAFVAWRPDTTLIPNRFRIPEPGGAPVEPGQLQVLCLPLVGWSAAGERLGMGAGFYDRFLAEPGAQSLFTVGLAYECQREDSLAELREPWDVALHAIVTEQRWYSLRADAKRAPAG